MKRRRVLISLLAAITAAALLFVAPLGAQSETETESVPEELTSLFAPTETVVLGMGDTLETPEWDLQVQNLFVAPSPEENGYSEVKIAIVMRNNLETPIPYRLDGFHSTLGYPRLTVTDSAGNSYPYSLNRLSAVALPGSTLIDILPGLSGRWTVGFRVLTPFADAMTLEATGSTAIGQWALTPGGALDGFPPPDIEPAGEEIAWSEDLVVMPRNHGSIVCGDPDRQLVTQIFAIAMDVMNEGTTDRLFPGTRYPDDVAIAQWPNGAASRMVAETHSGDVEALQWAQDATVIAPGATLHARSMVFVVPRDGRLGLVDDDPQGILLQLPDGRQRWLDVSGKGTLMLDPAFCDNGALLGPTPYGFAPGPAFDVALADLGIDNVTANRAAIELVNEAAVAAAALIGSSGDFGDITPSALAATGSPLSFATGLVAGAPEVVGVEVFPDEDGVAFSTQSDSGLWYCLTLDPQGGLATFSAFNSEAVATLCLPSPTEAPLGEAATEGEGVAPKTTEPPTTTTTVPATTTTTTPTTTTTTTTTIPQTPSLTIVKDVDLATISAPGTLTYTITVDNTGNVDLTNVVLTDVFAGGAILDSGDDGDAILETTETWIYTADYDVTQADINAGTDLVNTASVDTDQTAPASDDATTTITQTPSLTIVKDVDLATISAPGTLTYTITVDNTGNVDLTNVVLTDVFAGGAILDSGDDGDAILEMTETWIYTADYDVTQADINAGTDLVNTASVDTDQTAPASDDATTTITQTPSLTIVKDVDQATISAPGTLLYTITVDNTGNVDLTNVVLTDFFAGGATLDSGDDGDAILEITETWIYIADYDVTAGDILDGTDLVNTASVDTDQTAPASDDATTIII